MIIPSIAKRKRLDNLGRQYNVKRRKFLWIALESDEEYRNRIVKRAIENEKVNNIQNTQI